MFTYERTELKRALQKTQSVLATGARFVSNQVSDPAIRRALILGGAAYFIRKAPFLDQQAAEGLSDKLLILTGVLLSRLPGSAELAKGKGGGESQ